MNADSKTYKSVCITLLTVVLCSVGCTQSIQWKTPKIFSLDSSWPFRDKDAPRKGTPVRIVGTWTDTVLTQPGQKPQRGFGGRLMFYDKEGDKPILVDGQLVVYAFDEDGRDPTDNKPTRRYVFPADQMPIHMSKSEIGASYSFWLPWDEVGGPRTEVSLISRFEPKSGGVVTSEQTRQVLPGPPPSKTAKITHQAPPEVPVGVPTRPPQQTLESLQRSRNEERNARLISYEAPATPASPQPPTIGSTPQVDSLPVKHMTTTTIALPPNYQLPNAAELNAAAPVASYPQLTAQGPQQIGTNISPLQQPAAVNRTYVSPSPMVMPMAPAQPLGLAPTYMGQTYMGASQPQQAPINTQATTFAGTPQMMPLQQYQQPVMQPAVPQRPILQQSWPQVAQAPGQMAQATVTYPASGQVAR
ncbi:MAG TPA: hypothetical protein VHE81_09010 [Lacipirellulaceae bacterium]|nr:hypothetical protein [Lacipirellulaceae bacterium]